MTTQRKLTMAEQRAARSARRKSIRYLVLRLLLVALALLALQGLIYYRHYRATRQRELQANLELARAAAVAFGDLIAALHRVEAAVGYALTTGGPMSHEQQMRFLLKTAKEFPAVRTLVWISPQGEILAASQPELVGKSARDAPWFQQLASGAEKNVSNTTRSRDPRQEYFVAARALRDQRGELLGVVAAEVSTQAIDLWITTKRLPGGTFELVDQSGWLAYRSSPQPLPAARDWAKTHPLVRKALEGHEAVGKQRVAYSGRQELAAEVPVPEVGWVAGASSDESTVLGRIWSGILLDLAIVAAILLAAALVALGTARKITAPLSRLRQHAAEVAKGNLEHRTELDEPSELTEVAEALNQMTRAAKQREEEQRLRMQAERERARLAEQVVEEVSHHVRNTLAMITGLLQMQTSFHPDPKTEQLLRESIARIRTFANVHELIYATRAPEVDLLEALRRVTADTVQVLHPRDAIETSVEGEQISYPTRVVTNLAVAVNELVSNAIRHGAPGADGRQRIDLRVTKENGTLHLSLANTGPPVAEDFDPRQHPTMGLQLILDLIVTRYQGSFTLRPTPEGNLADIRVPEAELLEKE